MIYCPICAESTFSRQIKVRGGKEMTIWHCDICDYDFFTHDPTSSLAADNLDQTRLKSSGLDIPERDADFINGIDQSLPYIDEYISTEDKGANILEIGCSWGYFLRLLKDAGASPFGVEVNRIRAQYVNDELNIPCFTDIESCEFSSIMFKKIFLFYVIEYIPDPIGYIRRLINMLEEGGSIIIISPNLNDALKDLYRNEGFGRFFYDEHAINYFSSKSFLEIAKRLNVYRTKIETRQGYSFINHINWFLTNGPRTTNIVGGDKFVEKFVKPLLPEDSVHVEGWDKRHYDIAAEMAKLINEFNSSYKKILEKNDYGNQIRFIIYK